MGHRFEIYLNPKFAEDIIAISKAFQIDAKVIGRCYSSQRKKLIIKTPEGELVY